MKRNILKLTICLTAFLLSSFQILSAQNLTDEIVLKAATPLIENEMVDGLSVGYIQGDRRGTVHLGHASNANAEEKLKPNNSTLYELGSISKVFTSLLLADAVVRGAIKLDGDANVPNEANIKFPTLNYRSVKWIDLSTHRSGLPRLPANFGTTDLIDPYRQYDSAKAAAALSTLKLPRSPGESQEYSNFAVSVLGYLISQNANKTYQNLLKERIARPLSMSDCSVALSEDQKNRLAMPHSAFGAPTQKWNWSDLPGAGGVCATMDDMMRFATAQLDPPAGKLGQAIELAWTQHTKPDDSGPAMGLGWMILDDGEARWHNGGTGGSRSMILINRAEKLAIVALCNTAVSGEVDQLPIQLMDMVTGKGEGKVAENASGQKNEVKISADHRARLEGRYELAANFIFDVKDNGGHLMVGVTNQPTLEVFPDSKTHWSYRAVKATLEFKLPKKGPAKSLILHQNGIKQTATRMGK
jgi:CubicO group peptidase (beta-lactamase class C family)